MTRFSVVLMLAGAWVALAGCSGKDGPTGPVAPFLDFQIQAPREIETKTTVEVLVTVTSARAVEFPLEVQIEKANAGQPFLLEGVARLFEGESTVAFVTVPRQDPRYRLTVTESGERGLFIQKIVSVEVLDFP
ncbi:MAG: hypothetical protein ACREMD_02300 [Gemmatimonadota bacterium]